MITNKPRLAPETLLLIFDKSLETKEPEACEEKERGFAQGGVGKSAAGLQKQNGLTGNVPVTAEVLWFL